MSDTIITKTCTKCKKVKPLSDFYKKKDRHTPHCKDCIKIYSHSFNHHLIQARYDKKRKLRFPHKLKAKYAVKHAVRNGKLPKASSLICICGGIAHDYHHESYATEHHLDVTAVCQPCHQNFHKP